MTAVEIYMAYILIPFQRYLVHKFPCNKHLTFISFFILKSFSTVSKISSFLVLPLSYSHLLYSRILVTLSNDFLCTSRPPLLRLGTWQWALPLIIQQVLKALTSGADFIFWCVGPRTVTVSVSNKGPEMDDLKHTWRIYSDNSLQGVMILIYHLLSICLWISLTNTHANVIVVNNLLNNFRSGWGISFRISTAL